MRRIILAAAAAFLFTTSAGAADPFVGYWRDGAGRCHDAHGKPVAAALCTPGHRPNCPAKSKACGNRCIALTKTCHVEG